MSLLFFLSVYYDSFIVLLSNLDWFPSSGQYPKGIKSKTLQWDYSQHNWHKLLNKFKAALKNCPRRKCGKLKINENILSQGEKEILILKINGKFILGFLEWDFLNVSLTYVRFKGMLLISNVMKKLYQPLFSLN